MKRQFKITDESNRRFGPCYVIRERKNEGAYGICWAWVAWSRTLEDADKIARSLGELTREGITLEDRI